MTPIQIIPMGPHYIPSGSNPFVSLRAAGGMQFNALNLLGCMVKHPYATLIYTDVTSKELAELRMYLLGNSLINARFEDLKLVVYR